MLRLTPILLAIAAGVAMYLVSAWRLNRQLDAQSSPLADPRLKAVTDRLARALELDRIKVHIYEVDPVNGLASPDGRVFITRGFYARFLNGEVTAEEMTSVVAHELGHVALGHARRRMADFAAQNAVRVVLGMVLSRFLPGIGGWLAGLLASMISARLSRQDEHEADAYAAALMTSAGIGVGPQVSLLRKVSGWLPNRGKVAWLMSHPETEARVAAIEALAERWRQELPRT